MLRVFSKRFLGAFLNAKEAVKGTAKEVAEDGKRAAMAASETLQDDFRAVADAVANPSDSINAKVLETNKERLHVAKGQEDRRIVFSEHAENTLNKTAKKVHDAKESIKEKVHDAKESLEILAHDTKEGIKETTQSATETVKSAAKEAKDSAIRASHSKGFSESRIQKHIIHFISI